MESPVAGMRARLAGLLAEWPEHPVLLQLDALCARLLGMPADTPVKVLMTGVELALARAQVWETTAARHVSIAPQLEALSALSLRWRRLELGGWRRLVERVRQHAAQGARSRGPRRAGGSCIWA